MPVTTHEDITKIKELYNISEDIEAAEFIKNCSLNAQQLAAIDSLEPQWRFSELESSMLLIQHAALSGEDKLLQALLGKGVHPDSVPHAQGPCAATPLSMACSEGKTAAVMVLLENGADPEASNTVQDMFGDESVTKPIMEVVGFSMGVERYDSDFDVKKQAFIDILDSLIKAGADINHKMGEDQMTPLMNAASGGCILTCKALCNQGANVMLKDKDGDDVVAYARLSSKPESYVTEIKNLVEAAKEKSGQEDAEKSGQEDADMSDWVDVSLENWADRVTDSRAPANYSNSMPPR